MHPDEKIRKRLGELTVMGEEVLATRRPPPPNVFAPDSVDSEKSYQWATSTQYLLGKVFGENSEYYKNFLSQTHDDLTFSRARQAQGVLKAAKIDFENEQLFSIRRLIEAEMFDDFLDQATQLLVAGYHGPAAVIAGCVLEDGLRKLCLTKGIVLSGKPKLDTMNSELAKANIYSRLVQKRITAIADLRNSAAHGQWDKFDNNDVNEMISSVRRIMEEHFS